MATLKDVRGAELRRRAVELAGGEQAWGTMTWQANRPDFDVVRWDVYGFRAEGYLGQHLIVLPQEGLVVVRMRRAPSAPFDEKKIDILREFEKLVLALVPDRQSK